MVRTQAGPDSSDDLLDGSTDVDYAAGLRGTVLASVLALVAALAVALAPVLGAAAATDGSERAGSTVAAVVAAVLALAVPVLTLVLLRGGRLAGAAGVLSGAGAVGLGLAVLDGQLFVRALDANRLELVRPVTAAELSPGPGAVAVLVGHVGLALAGALALRAVRSSGVLDEADELLAGRPAAARTGGPLVAAAVLGVLAAAGSLFAPAVTSTDPVLLVPPVLQGPVVLLVAAAVLAAGALVAVALALTASSAAAAAGVLVGTGLALLGLQAPRWAAAGLDGIGSGAGAVVGTVGAAVLVGAGALGAERLRRGLGPRAAVVPPARPGPALPRVATLHRLVQLAGLLAGALAVVAALLPPLTTTDGRTVPEIDTVRVLLLAGVVLAAVSAGLVGELAATLRPVVGVAWAGVLLGAGGVLQAVLVATTVTGVGWGSGAVLTVLALLAALGCAAVAGLAGAAERDDVDTSALSGATPPVRLLAATAALAAVLGLALPLYSAEGFRAPGAFSGAWGWDTWSQALAAVAVVVAVAVAVVARPARGAGLAVGAALVLVVHVAGWPLTAGRVEGAAAAAGALPAGLAVLLLAALAVLLGRGASPVVQGRGGRRGGR